MLIQSFDETSKVLKGLSIPLLNHTGSVPRCHVIYCRMTCKQAVVFQVWFQNKRSKERRMKQLTSGMLPRGFFGGGQFSIQIIFFNKFSSWLWGYYCVIKAMFPGHFGDFGFGPRFPGHPDFFPGGPMQFLGPHHGKSHTKGKQHASLLIWYSSSLIISSVGLIYSSSFYTAPPPPPPVLY